MEYPGHVQKFLEYVKKLSGVYGYVISAEGLPYELWGSFTEGDEEKLSANVPVLIRMLNEFGTEKGVLKSGTNGYFFFKIDSEFSGVVYGKWEIVTGLASLFERKLECPNCGFDLTFEVYECKCGAKLPFTIPYCPFCGRELTYKKCPGCGKEISISGNLRPSFWRRLIKW